MVIPMSGGNRITDVMKHVQFEQALYHRRDDEPPALQARSAGFTDAWCTEADRIVAGFGLRPGGIACPLAVFALPFTDRQVAVARAMDRTHGAARVLAFHFLVMDQAAYQQFAGDPFVLAQNLPADWQARGDMPAITWPAEPLPPRTVAQVQAVLRRVKASALREDEDPESPDFERTADNSESPALLGGVQVLVDGGKLVFFRPAGDLALIEGLWTLLPLSTRCKLWPATFAFGNELGFDVVVVPQVNDTDFAGYTTEEQAEAYPAGSYELALQTAAETGNQRDLDAVFRRRNSNEVLRLVMLLIVGMSLLVIASRWLTVQPPSLTVEQQKAAAAAGIVASGSPWIAVLELGKRIWREP
jgi:hypothetical protein